MKQEGINNTTVDKDVEVFPPGTVIRASDINIDDIKIDPEIRDMIPPRPPKELDRLRTSIQLVGCISPITVMPDPDSDGYILLKGHGRLPICIDFKIRPDIEIRIFDSKEKAKEWVIHNRVRQDLTIPARYRLVLPLKPSIEARARARQGARTDMHSNLNKGSGNTNQVLARLCDCSVGTIHKLNVIWDCAPDEVKDRLCLGDKKTSIDKEYKRWVPSDEDDDAATNDEGGTSEEERKPDSAADLDPGRVAKQDILNFVSAIIDKYPKTIIDKKPEWSKAKSADCLAFLFRPRTNGMPSNEPKTFLETAAEARRLLRLAGPLLDELIRIIEERLSKNGGKQ